MAMDRARRERGETRPMTPRSPWPGMDRGHAEQDGGWAAFDVNNLEYYLNNIPFSDHGALLDPPTEDVTARCHFHAGPARGDCRTSPAVAAGIAYLRKTQLPEGSWYGRWGLNYIYGTWSVLAGFGQTGIGADDQAVRRAVDWLNSRQNSDGGWGESNDSYAGKTHLGERTASTPHQSAWALLALMAAGQAGSVAARCGIEYLLRTQETDGLWSDPHFTAPGFRECSTSDITATARISPSGRWRRTATLARPGAAHWH